MALEPSCGHGQGHGGGSLRVFEHGHGHARIWYICTDMGAYEQHGHMVA